MQLNEKKIEDNFAVLEKRIRLLERNIGQLIAQSKQQVRQITKLKSTIHDLQQAQNRNR